LVRGRIDEAAELFASSVWGAVPEANQSHFLSRVCQPMPDGSRRKFLSTLLRGQPEDRFVFLKLAAIDFREHRHQEAMRRLEAAERLGPLPAEGQVLEVQILIVLARFDEAYDLAVSLYRQHPQRPDFARRAIQAANLSGRGEEMMGLLRDALSRWPRDWLLLFRYNRCTCPMAFDRELFASLSREFPSMTGDDRWLFQYAVMCLRHGVTDCAMEILNGFVPESPVSTMAPSLRDALSAFRPSDWSNPRGVDNDPDRDVQIVRTAEAISTVIVLAGMQGGLGYLPFTHADGVLARHRVNVVYLRDLNNRGFQSGVRGLGPDLSSTSAELERICGGLGPPVVTIGASLGGTAAVHFAIAMGASAAVSFAGPTHLGAVEDELSAPSMNRSRTTMYSWFSKPGMSLIERIRGAPGTHIHHCFGAAYAPDVADAASLSGIHNVTLHSVEGCADHHVLERMIACGAFDQVLRQATAQAS
jgi:tetratricopeptide (TPR) repeat protein